MRPNLSKHRLCIAGKCAKHPSERGIRFNSSKRILQLFCWLSLVAVIRPVSQRSWRQINLAVALAVARSGRPPPLPGRPCRRWHLLPDGWRGLDGNEAKLRLQACDTSKKSTTAGATVRHAWVHRRDAVDKARSLSPGWWWEGVQLAAASRGAFRLAFRAADGSPGAKWIPGSGAAAHQSLPTCVTGRGYACHVEAAMLCAAEGFSSSCCC
jgi:hypothetical protein